MAYLTLLSLSEGRRAGFSTVAGIALGLFLIALIAALGMSALIEAYPPLYQLIRWGGVLYLLWLAWQSWREKDEIAPDRIDLSAYHARYFRRGLITNLLNPKAALFYATVLPGFLVPGEPALRQAMWLTLISVGVATMIHLLIVLLADRLRRILHHTHQRRAIRQAMAVLLGAVALWLFFATA